MRSFRQRSFLSLLALHDVIDDDWLVHAVSFIFPYFCVYFHLFAQAKRLGRRRVVVVVVVVQFPPRQPPPPPLLSSSSFSRRGAHPPKLFLLLLLLARTRKWKREKFSPLDASKYSSVVKVCSFFDERFSIDRVFFFFLSLSTKKNKNEQKKLLGGWNYSFFFFFSHNLCRCFCCFCSPTLPKATFFSADDKDATKHHRHHFCRRSWYSSESNKEELEKEIGYYTGKKRNPLTDTRLHQYDQRPPPNALCEICSRRFCSCEENRTMKRKPEMPGPEDCCQSSPQCKFCVWTIYDEQLAEYETNKELYMDKLK